MSREDKVKSLYSAVGEVNDRFIQEAAEYGKAHGSNRRVAIVTALAAALTAVAVFASVIGKMANKTSDNAKPSQAAELTEFSKYVKSVSTADKAVSTDSLNMYGQPAIYWSLDGGETVYMRKITATEYTAYEKTLDGSSDVPADEQTLVWVCDENGNVSSPYLKQTSGNTAFGHLFDYSPEVTPSDSCMKYLKEFMN